MLRQSRACVELSITWWEMGSHWLGTQGESSHGEAGHGAREWKSQGDVSGEVTSKPVSRRVAPGEPGLAARD